MNILFIIIKHINHPISTLTKLFNHIIFNTFRFDNKIHPRHDNLNVLPDQGMVLLHYYLIQ